ncbi:hypothetical protein Hdeb2414_s0004g00132121 [Helianthus debilis subsp. tardiflorus]
MSNYFRRARERERPGGTAPPPETFPTEAVIISGLTAIAKRRIRHVKLFSERKRERERDTRWYGTTTGKTAIISNRTTTANMCLKTV